MPLALDLLEAITTGMDDGLKGAGLQPLPNQTIDEDLRPFLQPRQLFNDHFEKIEWTSSAGSSIHYAPITDMGTPDFYRMPEHTANGKYTLFESGEPLRDSLYRGSSLTFFQPLKNGGRLFAEFYDRRFQFPYRENTESAPREVKMRGVNLGIKF